MGEALHLQCNQLTREGAKTFGAVMKEKRVLHLVDLRDNKQEVSTTTHSADALVAAPKTIPCVISPKEAPKVLDPNVRRSINEKYRKGFLAKPKYAGKKQITGSVSQKSKTLSKSISFRPVCSNPGVLVKINKLPLRPKSAPERPPKSVFGTPRIARHSNLIRSITPQRALDSEHEFPCERISNNLKKWRCKEAMDLASQNRETSTARPKSAPGRTPLCPARRTPREKGQAKNSGSSGSVPGSARKSQKSTADEIAPWDEDGDVTAADARQNSSSPSSSTAHTQPERKSDTSTQEGHIRRKPERKIKKRKSGNQRSQFPNYTKATYRTVTALVAPLGNKNMPTCAEKPKRKPKIKPNVVKRRELLFQSGIEATAEAHGLSTGVAMEVARTPIVANEEKEPLPAPFATEEDSEWNSFMSEMTKTLLNVNVRLPPRPEIV